MTIDDTETPLDVALSYAHLGFKVFPLHTPIFYPDDKVACSCGNRDCKFIGKHPRTEHGLKDATDDEEMIRQYWGKWEYANIGILINEKTGTVVVGKDVRLLEAAVSHGNLTIQISAIPIISQPAAFSRGRTVVVPQTMTTVREDDTGNVQVLAETATLNDLATALNSLQVKPRDMIAIFQALKQAGALRADLVIM